MNYFTKVLVRLTKNITRKNLHKFIAAEIDFKKKKKILNIGAGGLIEEYLKNFKNLEIVSIDIDKKRKPDFVIDITNLNQLKKIKYDPDIICCFEVLEHIPDPQTAINNLFKICEKKTKLLVSVPFNFPIHDEPHDYFRFTKYGLAHLFKKFSNISITERDGWIDVIFVFLIRLKTSKSFFLKIISNMFIIIYYILYPVNQVLQNLFQFKNMTSGYFIVLKK